MGPAAHALRYKCINTLFVGIKLSDMYSRSSGRGRVVKELSRNYKKVNLVLNFILTTYYLDN